VNIKRNIKATGKRLVLLLFLLTVAGGLLHGQHTLALLQQLSCENNSVTVPLHVSDFDNVGSFTLFIEIDTLMVAFDGLTNPHALLAGGSLVYNFMSSTSSIVITWFSVSGVSISEGTLVNLKLDYYQDQAGLAFSPDCELANPEGEEILNVVYTDGWIMPAIQFALQPLPQTVTEGEQAQFSIELLHSGDHDFLWQQHDGTQWNDLAEDDHFSGVNSALLTIDDVPLGFNNTAFRCVVAFDNCIKHSDSAGLTVSPLTVVNASHQRYPVLKAWPNPAYELLNFKVGDPVKNYRLSVINLVGETVREIKLQQLNGQLNINDLPAGIYFLQLTDNETTLETLKIIKQ
jgi:hypothetical protein